ncbi:MAG: hypothetical protein K9J13_15340 [Saprospiraceae bacterium]|nr:hypothetical protein [Saprospiraceae bacterium]
MKKIILLGLLLLNNATLFSAQDSAPAANQQGQVPSLQSIATLSTLQMMKDEHPNIYNNPELFEEKLKENKTLPDSVKKRLIDKYQQSKEITSEAARLWVRDGEIGFTPFQFLRLHKPELARLVDQGLPWNFSFQDLINAGGEVKLKKNILLHNEIRTGYYHHLSLTSLKGLQNISLLKIQKLDLSNNRLPKIHPDTFNYLSLLNVLDLSWNQLPEIHPDTFNYLSLLNVLDLSYNKLLGIHPDTFNKDIKLKKLNLSHNELEEILPNTLKSLKHLNVLDLSWNQLKKIHPDTFNTLIGVDEVLINNNKLTQKQVALIRAQMPARCTIL